MIERKIVKIDEEKCNGCGLCVPACHEGAIKIIDGKARLTADILCDGLGDCLGQCPLGAITIIEREAEDYDAEAVRQHLARQANEAEPAPCQGGCPGSRAVSLSVGRQISQVPDRLEPELVNWPVQLHLIPVHAPYFHNSELLVCADCVPFAYPDFHGKMLRGRTVAIACPKLDETQDYAAKLAAIIANNQIRRITVAHMEVPCCSGLVYIVRQAVQLSGIDVELADITVNINGGTKAEL